MKKGFIFIAILSIIILLLLSKNLGSISLHNDRLPYVIYTVIILSVVIINVANSKMPFQKIIKYTSAWTLIIGVLLIGYTYKNDLKKVLNNVYANIVPGAIIEEKEQEESVVRVIANQSGHFFVNSVVNGVEVRFLIDTGATDVVLTRYDAKRLGIDLNKLSYTRRVTTANGTIWSARVKLDYIKIGSITIHDVVASIGQEDKLDTGLLGMSFLNRLKSYHVYDNSLAMIGE